MIIFMAALLALLLLAASLPEKNVPGVGAVKVWDHYVKHEQEYGADYASYFFSDGPRQQRECGDAIVQWSEMENGLYRVAVFGVTSRLFITSIPMTEKHLIRLLRQSGCDDDNPTGGHSGHDMMSQPAYAW